MRCLILLLCLTSACCADDWTRQLSPRMRRAIQPMVAPGWSPKKEVELTATERSELQQLFPLLQQQARTMLRAPVQERPTPRAPESQPTPTR